MRSVTFISPHLRATSGGVYAICEFARHLATRIEVSLVYHQGPAMGLPGVRLVESEVVAENLPDADAVILYADSEHGQQFASLPDSKGEKLILFQGYGALGNPTVTANLERGFRSLCTARWLVDEAEARGSRSAHVPYGVDAELFFTDGRPRRPHSVAMLTHRLDWKGTEDGLEALRLVEQTHPRLDVTLFGVWAPKTRHRWLDKPSRREVGELFRETTVFVCPSWEEGFGMPGLEALACGASLATTDTKGSRDYAFDDRTALVTEPRDPRAQAAAIRRLLDDAELRARFRRAGQEAVAGYGSWDMAAERFLAALRG